MKISDFGGIRTQDTKCTWDSESYTLPLSQLFRQKMNTGMPVLFNYKVTGEAFSGCDMSQLTEQAVNNSNTIAYMLLAVNNPNTIAYM